MSEALASFPFIFGLIAAIIHVIAGPDHLAAVGPLAVRARLRPWFIGVSWGIGHVLGMLLIGLVFFFFRELIPIDYISDNSERIVGLLLIVIGFWALYKTKSLVVDKHAHAHTHQNADGSVYVHKHDHDHSSNLHHAHSHKLRKQENQSYWAAAGIGVLHGFAGVSHIVSMLPTLAFETNFEAIQYLVGFAIGTIVAMLLFSFILGVIAKKATEKKKNTIVIGINLLLGLAAVVVGIIWILNTW